MSDGPMGDGWWEASDGKWYPPDTSSESDPAAQPTQAWAPGSVPPDPSYSAPDPNAPAPGTGPSSFTPPSPGITPPSPGFAPPGQVPVPPPAFAPPAGPPPAFAPPGAAPPGFPPPAAAPPGYSQPGHPPPGLPPQAYPQPGQPAWAPGPVGPPPKSSRRGLWIVLGVIVTLLILIGGCTTALVVGARNAGDDGGFFEIVNELSLDFSAASPAIGPSSCEVDGIQNDGTGDYLVLATVTNESGETSAYEVNYELTGPAGESLGTDFGIISRVEPGETVTDNTIGIIDGNPDPADVTCSVFFTGRIPVE